MDGTVAPQPPSTSMTRPVMNADWWANNCTATADALGLPDTAPDVFLGRLATDSAKYGWAFASRATCQQGRPGLVAERWRVGEWPACWATGVAR